MRETLKLSNMDAIEDEDYETEIDNSEFAEDESDEIEEEKDFVVSKTTNKNKESLSQKQRLFNENRVLWFKQYMNNELPALHSMRISEDRYVLLEAKEQMMLARLIQAGIVAKIMLSEVDASIRIQKSIVKDVPMILEMLHEQKFDAQNLSSSQLRYANLIMEDAEYARVLFAEKNLGLVEHAAAKRTRIKGMSPSDCEEIRSEGKIGLMTAIDKFNPALGYKFSTPATFWINQSILSFLDSKTKMIKMPTHMNTIFKNIQYAQKELRDRSTDDTQISNEDIATWLAEHDRTVSGKPITAAMIEQAQNMRRETISYDAANAASNGQHELSLIEMIESEDHIEDEVTNELGGSANFNAMLILISDARKREILRDWYSSDADQELVTLSNVARKHGLTKERVKQLKTDAEQELRTKLSTPEMRAKFNICLL